MARSALTVQGVTRSGLTPAFVAANSDGNSFPNDGKTWIHLRNTNAAVTVTVQIPVTVDGQSVSGRTVVVGATTGEKVIGPFPVEKYNQFAADAGSVYVNYSAITGLSVGAFALAGD